MPGDAPETALTRRAFEWLDLPAGAPAATVRATICRQLAAADYLPDPTLHEAILTAAGQAVAPAGSLLAADAEAATRHAVEAFAAEFFAIPVLDRLSRWQALRVAAADDPRVVARLDRLQPGLTIDPQAITAADPKVEWLANDLMNLFVAPAAHRPVWLRGMLVRLESRRSVRGWKRSRATQSIRRLAPALAESGCDYLQRIKPSSGVPLLIGLMVAVLAVFVASRWTSPAAWMPSEPITPATARMTKPLHSAPASPR